MSHPWDDLPKGNYWKAENVGDKIVGVIRTVGIGRDFNGDPCPELVVDTDDGEKTITCAQANLKAQIVAMDPRPKPGDKIGITFSGKERAALGEKKVFTIQLKAGEPVRVPDEEAF